MILCKARYHQYNKMVSHENVQTSSSEYCEYFGEKNGRVIK